MRRRRRTVRLVGALALALTASTVSNASLETDCYFAGGYFDPTYVASGYFDETCGTAPPSPVSGTNTFRNLLRFPGIWR